MVKTNAFLLTLLVYIPIVGRILAVAVWPAIAYFVRAIYRKVMGQRGNLAWFPLATMPMLCYLVHEKYLVAYIVTFVATVVTLGTSLVWLFLLAYGANLLVLAIVYSNLFKKGWKTLLLVILPVVLPYFLYTEFLKEEK